MSNTDFFPIERNRYFYGKLLTVRDFEVEQRYNRQKDQLLNRLSLGAGVVCGLGVSAVDDSTLLIESGMALDYQGRMVAMEEPVLRKLQMLDGHQDLLGKNTAYLCLTYDESDLEPVNAVGADTGASRQFNMTRESSRLYLTAEPPELEELLEAKGQENNCVLYTSQELSLVLTVPEAITAGEEFPLQVLVVKNENTPPVHFTLEGESTFAESESGRLSLTFQESPEEKRRVYTVEFQIKARQLSEMDSSLFTSGGELDLELGSHRYKNYIDIPAKCRLCRNREIMVAYRRSKDSLERHLRGRDLPIYLAKLELINSAGSVFLASVTDLPFQQVLSRDGVSENGSGPENVTTTVRSLEYWQKPDVKASYQASTGNLHFDFGLPVPEQYDYAVAHGTVDLTMPGGLRVNSHVYSEEIPHGLGPGAVDIRLSLEFPDQEREGEKVLLYGNSEVFKAKKNSPLTPPWAEAAVVVYPERGTMRIGLWLHDMVDGNRMTVHYFAQKPERDTSRILAQRKVSLQVKPEFSRVSRGGSLRLQGEVVGSDDKQINWSIREENGGAIDKNGLYRAPELPGTYEIVAVASADETVTASAFVVVE